MVNVEVAHEVAAAARACDVDLGALLEKTVHTVEVALGGVATDLRIDADRRGAIPGVGVGGSTDVSTGAVVVSMDLRGQYDARVLFERWLPATIAHELHHAKRVVDGPGMGRTFLDRLVAEGSADAFVEEAFPWLPPSPWTRALTPRQTKRFWAKARRRFAKPHTPRVQIRWFFGVWPRPAWTGYSLGFTVAQGRLANPPTTTAAALATESTADIVARSTPLF